MLSFLVLIFLGHEVEHVSHVGDFGAPLGMVVAEAIERQLPFVQMLQTDKQGMMELRYNEIGSMLTERICYLMLFYSYFHLFIYLFFYYYLYLLL
jgi:arginyl-tRNA synthetase